MNKKSIIVVLLTILVSAGFSQNPQISGYFDTDDSCFGNAAAGDIDSDGKLEIVFSCYRNDGRVYALNAEDASLLWEYDAGGCCDAAPLIIDADLDGSLDVVVAGSCIPATFCLDGSSGELLWRTFLHGSDSPPSAADVDGDGKPEIIQGNFDGYVTCLDAENGMILWDVLVDPDCWIQTAPAIIDAAADEPPDVIVASWNFADENKIYRFNAEDGDQVWECDLPTDYIYHGAAVADLDGDGLDELAIGTYDGVLLVLNAEDGSLLWEFSLPEPIYIGSPTTIADFNGDGSYEIAFFDSYRVGVLSAQGDLLWSVNLPNGAQSFRGAAATDLDGDGSLDLAFGGTDGAFYGLNGGDGSEIFRIDLESHFGKEFEIDHAPIIADFDGDGLRDAFVVGGKTNYPDIENNYGRAYFIDLDSPGGPDWLMFRRDSSRKATVPLADPGSVSDNDFRKLEIISIYPNPAFDEIILKIKSNSNCRYELTIFDTLGEEMFAKSGYSNEKFTAATIKIRDLRPGIYFTHIKSGGYVGKSAFVKI